MESVPQVTHLPIGMEPLTWRVGPLDRRQTAGLCAEIQSRIKQARLRPDVAARIVGETAEVYVRDWHASALLVLLLAEDYRGTVTKWPEHDGQESSWLDSLGVLTLWATRPTRGAPDPEPGPTCVVCKESNTDPAPGLAAPTHCRSCWQAKVSAGKARALAAEQRLRARALGQAAV
jgi:hypothetical protein